MREERKMNTLEPRTDSQSQGGGERGNGVRSRRVSSVENGKSGANPLLKDKGDGGREWGRRWLQRHIGLWRSYCIQTGNARSLLRAENRGPSAAP